MFIERLTLAQRNRAGLRKAEARTMHIVDESKINIPLKPSRYNIRQADGSIKKYTLFDGSVIVDTLKRVAGKYIRLSK